MTRIGQCRGNLRPKLRGQSLVGIQGEDPIAGGQVQRPVLLGAKTRPIGWLGNGGAKFLGDRNGSVGTGRIDHHHLLGKPSQGGKAVPKIGLFITSDEYDG